MGEDAERKVAVCRESWVASKALKDVNPTAGLKWPRLRAAIFLSSGLLARVRRQVAGKTGTDAKKTNKVPEEWLKVLATVKGAWKCSKRCLVERSGKVERSEKDRKNHLKPFVSNGFNRNFGELSRKKAAQNALYQCAPRPTAHTVILGFDPLQTAKIRRYRPFLAVEPRLCEISFSE